MPRLGRILWALSWTSVGKLDTTYGVLKEIKMTNDNPFHPFGDLTEDTTTGFEKQLDKNRISFEAALKKHGFKADFGHCAKGTVWAKRTDVSRMIIYLGNEPDSPRMDMSIHASVDFENWADEDTESWAGMRPPIMQALSPDALPKAVAEFDKLNASMEKAMRTDQAERTKSLTIIKKLRKI